MLIHLLTIKTFNIVANNYNFSFMRVACHMIAKIVILIPKIMFKWMYVQESVRNIFAGK